MLKVVIAPDSILNTVCDPCTVGDPTLKGLAEQMAETMYESNGCGLAGPQVGVTKRIVVIDCDDSEVRNPITLVNPVLVETRGNKVCGEEGCLSLPGITVEISRPEWARVTYFDLEGNACEISGDGLLGRCLQHELDHLDGKTMLESCNPLNRLKALRDYETALASGARPGETSVR